MYFKKSHENAIALCLVANEWIKMGKMKSDDERLAKGDAHRKRRNKALFYWIMTFYCVVMPFFHDLLNFNMWVFECFLSVVPFTWKMVYTSDSIVPAVTFKVFNGLGCTFLQNSLS